jgi:hypothetical protein
MPRSARRQDHYEVLGVNPDAPDEVVRAAYRALAAKYHPDRNPGDPDAELKLKRVNAAYAVLGNSEKRKQYDELTETPEAPETTTRAEPPKEEQPRWKVPEPEAAPAEPRWKVSGEEHRAHTVPAPTTGQEKQTPAAPRVFLACAAAGLSFYINVSRDGFNQNESALMGMVIGCGVLALFVYWLAGKISPLACGLGLALVAAAALSMRDGCDETPRSKVGNAVPTTTVQASETSAAPPLSVPDVPPLLANETSPSDGPDYIEPREMSAGGIVAAFDSCDSSARKSDPTLNAGVLSSYCTCFVDVFRRNFGTAGDLTKATPTMDQIKKCAAAARTGSSSPFAYASPRGTAEIWKTWTACIKDNGDKDHGIYCDCLADLDTAAKAHAHVWPDVPGKQTAPQFVNGCQVADQYWAATKVHLTVRQFKAMVLAASQ